MRSMGLATNSRAKTSIRPVNRNIHQGRHRTERSRASHGELDVANTL